MPKRRQKGSGGLHPAPQNAACPACGGREWSTDSDGLGDATSVAAACVSCHYVTTSVVDLSQDATESGSDVTLGKMGHTCDTGWFDRTICPEPCGVMHSYCATCGKLQDACPHEGPGASATR